jgi:hypothetical protein
LTIRDDKGEEENGEEFNGLEVWGMRFGIRGLELKGAETIHRVVVRKFTAKIQFGLTIKP